MCGTADRMDHGNPSPITQDGAGGTRRPTDDDVLIATQAAVAQATCLFARVTADECLLIVLCVIARTRPVYVYRRPGTATYREFVKMLARWEVHDLADRKERGEAFDLAPTKRRLGAVSALLAAGESGPIRRTWEGGLMEHRNEATGNEATGNPASGNEATGDEAPNNPASGNEATGNEATGNPASGNEATGDEATGNPAQVSDDECVKAWKKAAAFGFKAGRGRVTYDECLSIAGEAAAKARLTFRPDKASFSTYLCHKVRYLVLTHIRKESRYEHKDEVFWSSLVASSSTLNIETLRHLKDEEIDDAIRAGVGRVRLQRQTGMTTHQLRNRIAKVRGKVA